MKKKMNTYRGGLAVAACLLAMGNAKADDALAKLDGRLKAIRRGPKW